MKKGNRRKGRAVPPRNQRRTTVCFDENGRVADAFFEWLAAGSSTSANLSFSRAINVLIAYAEREIAAGRLTPAELLTLPPASKK